MPISEAKKKANKKWNDENMKDRYDSQGAKGYYSSGGRTMRRKCQCLYRKGDC